jgi:serine phosphatase RsbU (regulator of sigma subunit)
MAAVGQKAGVRELLIHTPDGKVRALPLDRDRFSLGRSSANELCYADDVGLSRQHLALEREGSAWIVRDLGSKNGTFVNAARITEPYTIAPNDRIAAGHLVLEFADKAAPMANTVVFVEATAATPTTAEMVSLEHVLSAEKEIESGQHMKALINAGRELAGHRPLAELFELIMDLSIKAVGAARGVLMTIEGDDLQVRAAKGEGFRISSQVRDMVVTEKRSLLVRDARLDDAFAGRMSIVQQQIRSMLAVPLQTDNRVIGLIYLDSPHFVHEFTKDDLNLLTVMANVAAIRIEHARLAEVEQAEKLLASELQQAAQIQRRLLPAVAPVVAGLELAGYNTPCRTVGGDYYDFIPYEDGRVAILVGDVAGKGMPAALLVSSLQARVQVLFDEPDQLDSRVTRLNRAIKTNCPDNRFITFFIGVLDPQEGCFTYCNAGHNEGIVVHRDGSVERLEATGLILGIMAGAVYAKQVCQIEPGDLLVLFSDGISEASRLDGEDFGEDRLVELLREHRSESAQAIIETVIQRVTEFIAGAPPADDITIVVAKRTA